MSGLGRNIFLGCAVLTLLCFSTMLIARTQPPPDIPGLAACGVSACYRGIVVGQTTWDEAQEIAANTLGWTLFKNPSTRGVRLQADAPLRSVLVYFKDDVFDMNLLFREHGLSVGDVVAQHGAPCAVFAGSAGDRLTLSYPEHLQVTIHTTEWWLAPDSLVEMIEIYSAEPYLNCNRSDTLGKSDWHGFFRSYSPLP
jgi:hypothetical protein